MITNHSLSSNSRAGCRILLRDIFLHRIFTGEGGVELSVDDPDEKVVTAVPALTALTSSTVAVELKMELEPTSVETVKELFDCVYVFESAVLYPRSANFARWCSIFNVCFRSKLQ